MAGTGTAGYSGDTGAATSAKLDNPSAAAVDASGNLYIADTYNSRIRKVTSAGIISTYAGDGTAGDTGDGDLAVNAELNLPMGVAVDGSGNVYIADYENNYVREVEASNQYIIPYAGTPYQATIQSPGGYSGNDVLATTAKLYAPIGLAVDSSDNLYIADSANQCVREVEAANKYIYLVAGNNTGGYSGDGGTATNAELYYPYAVAVDSYCARSAYRQKDRSCTINFQ